MMRNKYIITEGKNTSLVEFIRNTNQHTDEEKAKYNETLRSLRQVFIRFKDLLPTFTQDETTFVSGIVWSTLCTLQKFTEDELVVEDSPEAEALELLDLHFLAEEDAQDFAKQYRLILSDPIVRTFADTTTNYYLASRRVNNFGKLYEARMNKVKSEKDTVPPPIHNIQLMRLYSSYSHEEKLFDDAYERYCDSGEACEDAAARKERETSHPAEDVVLHERPDSDDEENRRKKIKRERITPNGERGRDYNRDNKEDGDKKEGVSPGTKRPRAD
jgi:hypothetical protein